MSTYQNGQIESNDDELHPMPAEKRMKESPISSKVALLDAGAQYGKVLLCYLLNAIH